MPRPYGYHHLDDEQKKLAEENYYLIWYFIKEVLDKKLIEAHEIDDLSSEIMLFYCLACESFNPSRGNKFSVYVYKSFYSALMNYRNSKKKFYSIFVVSDCNNDVRFRNYYVESKNNTVVLYEKIEEILKKLKFSEKEKSIIYMAHRQGLNFSETGKKISCSKQTTRNMYYRVIDKLKTYVEDNNLKYESFIEEEFIVTGK